MKNKTKGFLVVLFSGLFGVFCLFVCLFCIMMQFACLAYPGINSSRSHNDTNELFAQRNKTNISRFPLNTHIFFACG
jgi:hypothetical protein